MRKGHATVEEDGRQAEDVRGLRDREGESKREPGTADVAEDGL